MVIEDCKRFVAVEGKRRFEMLPFPVINLNGELLGTAEVAAVGGAVLFFQGSDFFGKFVAFSPPRYEDWMGVGFDQAKAFGGGFEFVGKEEIGFWCKAGHVAGDDVVFVPLGGESGLPDGLLEVGADGGLREEFVIWEMRSDVGAGDSGVGREIGETLRDGMIGGLEEEDAAFGGGAVVILEFAVAIAATGGLGEGVESAFGAVNDGEANIDTGFDELRGDDRNGAAFFSEPFGFGEDAHDVTRAHAGGEV